MYIRQSSSASPSLPLDIDLAFVLSSAASGKYRDATNNPADNGTRKNQIRCPFAKPSLTPVAYILVARIGAKARTPLFTVNASAFSVPKTAGEGEILLIASWMPAKGCQLSRVLMT